MSGEKDHKPVADTEPKQNPYKFYRDVQAELAKAKLSFSELHKDNKKYYEEQLQGRIEEFQGEKLAVANRLKDILDKTEKLYAQNQENHKSEMPSTSSSSTLNVAAAEFKPTANSIKPEDVDSDGDPDIDSVIKLMAKPGGFNISLSQFASNYCSKRPSHHSNASDFERPSTSKTALNSIEPETYEDTDGPFVTIYKAESLDEETSDDVDLLNAIKESEEEYMNKSKEGITMTVGEADKPVDTNAAAPLVDLEDHAADGEAKKPSED